MEAAPSRSSSVRLSAASLLWFGLEVRPGAALYVSCEDDIDEVHFRLEQIKADIRTRLAGCIPFAGRKGCASRSLQTAGMKQTLLFKDRECHPAAQYQSAHPGCSRRCRMAARGEPVADPHLYPDPSGPRDPARLRRRSAGTSICRRHEDRMRLFRHLHNGTTRFARMYFTRATASDDSEPDPDLRILELAKSNRGKIGQKIFMRWHDGMLRTRWCT